jgi:excisionase family DNA binding protein
LLAVNKTLLTIPEAAMVCSLSRGTIWKYVKSGDLKASMTPGGQYRIHKADLEAFMHRNKMHPMARYKPINKKILIVDDEPNIQKTLTWMLSYNGLQTEVAGDGFEAGIKVMSFKPGLIILDLFMPGIDGFEVCRRIKEDKVTSHIKVLAITGYDSPENRDRIMALGADGYMAKPLERKTLLQNVYALLNNRERIKLMK